MTTNINITMDNGDFKKEKKELILIVDDSQASLDFLFVTLTEAGYDVDIYQRGEIAVGEATKQQPSLILLDVMMPSMDGFEICERLKSQPETRDIPIIFMTALTDTQEKVKGLYLGAVDYITKPFQQEEVLARIKVHLNLRRLNLELDEQKQELEKRVLERTSELSQALEELKKTQLQLVQREKTSSLGQVVSGVAHEVNNPLGFISNNINYANQYVADLIHLIQLYKQHFPLPGDEIEKISENIDLEHILDDLPKVISSMKLGSDRIQQIMYSLRKFSLADEYKKKAVDIHEGIETTLMILQHRLKETRQRPTIKLFKEYGNLPKIECFPGQLNQVFLNLLSHAIDALEDNMSNPAITIRTMIDKTHLTISIADNGGGMSETFINQMFVPFVGEKLKNQDTSLGLSISHQIITQKHGGELKCISIEGEGTEFWIYLPVN
ncbi:hybrid sensor histidine kinase/response regulator [Calothrix sp. 336/3]|uniref:hybrid sensor histidine kinase/response regulator n=1 Tax=Calothrix sp. 336/3 TaxID=1337936 RepID=UPI000624E9C6|nr:response regulator [Calothrix sp. 336/3]AKG21553.1 hypothetical protein IJ00_09950 [Calothrix sp. 336/3]